eukprot:CAMPEP_0116019472 /NCGR_PEP_ID=MMETSP0321-20121206/9259_1 /TAXON_ID=163516 /ORGANISM="Leptocylindrus danicus var. danicus, Strain B650" /LENGTH=276 /DNA_ID=CAMNT_0003490053 /DNA_START=39 /DNA_END=866 /DNA_ORIENTATION=+
MAAHEGTQLLNGQSTAREAFEKYDTSASRTYHDVRHTSNQSSEEMHQKEGDNLKAIIFGGLDGILTSFAIVAGAAGGNLTSQVVLILGFSNIFADALSMGVGEFLSSKAHNEWVLSERKREAWEMENYPEGEVEEMIDIYTSRGMTREDATTCITTMSRYKDFFIDVMMMEELNLQLPEEDHVKESLREGVVMFCSFAFFGAFPLLGYVLVPLFFPQVENDEDALFVVACCVTGVVLFVMGSVKSVFSAAHWFTSGMETLLLGGACASLAYTIGQV